MLTGIAEGKNIDIQYAIIDGNLDIRTIADIIKENTGRLIIRFRISIRHSEIRGETYFTETTFNSIADFGAVIFNGGAYFIGATFEREAYFGESTFVGLANFYKSTFSSNVDFRLVTFGGGAYFIEATFNGEAYFRESAFSVLANFYKSKFKGYSDFIKVTFNSEAYFRESIFGSYSDFIRATFSGEAYFRESTFVSYSDFIGVTFNGEAYFIDTRFFKDAFFNNAIFHQHLFFDYARLYRNISFRETKFSGGVSFDGIILENRDFSICLEYNELHASEVGQLLTGLDNLYNMILERHYPYMIKGKSALGIYEIQTSGSVINIRFGRGKKPVIYQDDKGAMIVEIPDELGIIYAVRYLLIASCHSYFRINLKSQVASSGTAQQEHIKTYIASEKAEMELMNLDIEQKKIELNIRENRKLYSIIQDSYLSNETDRIFTKIVNSRSFSNVKINDVTVKSKLLMKLLKNSGY